MSLKQFPLKDEETRRLLRKFQQSAPVDVVRMAEELGINVWEDDLPLEISGKLFRDDVNGGTSGFSIVLRENDPLVRKRFTAAHEVAHYLLHKDQIGTGIEDSVIYRSRLSDAVEREANRLAAEILMPVKLIQEALNINANVNAIAQRLLVSEAALKIRLGMPT